MQTLIFSDTHLTQRFNRKKFALLEKIISSSDKVIINGDFWDGYLTTFDRFVKSSWSKLFPLMLKKQTIYLYGNHDPDFKADSRVNLFSVQQAYELELCEGNHKYIIKHGNNIVPDMDKIERIPFIGLFKRFVFIFNFIESTGTKLFGRYFRKIFINRAHDNHKLANHAHCHLQQNEILICGHTHLATSNPEINYANTGDIMHRFATYITIENGDIHLNQTRL